MIGHQTTRGPLDYCLLVAVLSSSLTTASLVMTSVPTLRGLTGGSIMPSVRLTFAHSSGSAAISALILVSVLLSGRQKPASARQLSRSKRRCFKENTQCLALLLISEQATNETRRDGGDTASP